MENNKEYLDQLAEIRRMMEKSSKFMSLSGFSGIFIGIYALIGALAASMILRNGNIPEEKAVVFISLIAMAVLVAALATGLWLTLSQSKKMHQKPWGPGSKLMLLSLALPLVTGGLFVLILIFRHHYLLIAPALLVFYGLALTSASRYTHGELFSAGLTLIILGLAALLFPAYGLPLWAVGFGGMHIVYGIYMYFRHERKTNTPIA